jgi:hypothetical protein
MCRDLDISHHLRTGVGKRITEKGHSNGKK